MLRRCSTSAVAGSTRLSRHLSRASLASSRRNNRALLSLRGKATASDRWNSVDGGGIGLETAAAAAVSAAGVESEMQASLAAWSGAGGHRLRRGSGQRCMQQQGGGGMLWEKKEAGWHLQGASGDGRVGAAGLVGWIALSGWLYYYCNMVLYLYSGYNGTHEYTLYFILA